MTPKQVPEGLVGLVSREEQLMRLHDDLLGNKTFGDWRGKLGLPTGELMKGIVASMNSPTGACHGWDAVAGELRVLLNLLAVFHRDGLQVCSEELLKALTIPGYFLPGETVPLEKTKPVTVIMLEPEITLAFIRLVLSNGFVAFERRFEWNKEDDRLRVILRAFPNLTSYYELQRAITGAVTAEMWEGFVRLVPSLISALFPSFSAKRVCRLMGEQCMHPRVIHVLPGEQGKVLGEMFSREEQQKIASWQFHLPVEFANAVVLSESTIPFGFHPETEHSFWEKESRAFTSAGVAAGLGCICLSQHREACIQGAVVSHTTATEGSERFACA